MQALRRLTLRFPGTVNEPDAAEEDADAAARKVRVGGRDREAMGLERNRVQLQRRA